jgi:hypothetical protein
MAIKYRHKIIPMHITAIINELNVLIGNISGFVLEYAIVAPKKIIIMTEYIMASLLPLEEISSLNLGFDSSRHYYYLPI